MPVQTLSQIVQQTSVSTTQAHRPHESSFVVNHNYPAIFSSIHNRSPNLKSTTKHQTTLTMRLAKPINRIGAARTEFKEFFAGLALLAGAVIVSGGTSVSNRAILAVLIVVCVLAWDVQENIEGKVEKLQALTEEEREQGRIWVD